MNYELMSDKDYRLLCDNQNYMQKFNTENMQANPYVIITSDFNPRSGAIDSIVMYVKAERIKADGLYVLEIRDGMYSLDDLEAYNCRFNTIYFYNLYTMCNYVPEVARERTLVCYDRNDVVIPLREEIAKMSYGHTELPCKIVDVREEAKKIWDDLPDYEIETVLAQCGYDADDFDDDALGTMHMIRCIYETILRIQGNERINVC